MFGLSRLSEKLSKYAEELAFAARAPMSTRQSLRLMQSTLAFHYRNWRKAANDPGPRLGIDLDLSGYGTSVVLRPRDGDISIFYEVLARDSYKLPDLLLPPASVKSIVDVGANIGIASLYLAATYPHARILSVEPNPDNFAMLEGNAAKEPRIVPIQACITPLPNQQVFITTTGRGSHFQMNTAGYGVSVRGMSLDELCREHEIDHIDLLKIDVEGAEEQIFADGSFLPSVRVVIAELHGNYTLERLNHDLARWGFRARISEHARDPNIVVAART